MKLPGADRINRIIKHFQELPFEKQGIYSIVLAKRLLRMSEEAFVNRNALDLGKLDSLVQVFYEQILLDKKNIEILEDSYQKAKLIYTFKSEELMDSQAIDAISIIETSLLVLSDGYPDFSECINSYIDSIDLFVQDVLAETSSTLEDRETLIYEHQAMQTELKFMEDFMEFLTKIKEIDWLTIEKVEDVFVFDPT